MKILKLLIISVALFITGPALSETNLYVDFIQRQHPNIPESRAVEINSLIKEYSEEYDVPCKKIITIMWQESAFRNVRSRVDINPVSAGYMQILTTTASWMLGRRVTANELIINYKLNIELGVRYLARMYHKYEEINEVFGRYNGVNNDNYQKEAMKKYEKVNSYLSRKRGE